MARGIVWSRGLFFLRDRTRRDVRKRLSIAHGNVGEDRGERDFPPNGSIRVMPAANLAAIAAGVAAARM